MLKKLKSVVKKYFPNFFSRVQMCLNYFRLRQNYTQDRKRFRKFAFNLRKDNDEVNLAARITFHYHAIEKGLSNPNFRKGFGKKALEKLMKALAEYLEKGFSSENKRFLSGIKVLQEYCNVHENNPEHTEEIAFFLSQLAVSIPNNSGGAIEYHRNEILPLVTADFLTLSNIRTSVRDYSDEGVDENLITDSISIAMRSPSVCNRQAWRVHRIHKTDLLEKTLSYQGGLTGNGANLKNLLLVTVDLRYFSGGNERNQGFVDGGIFLMSLVYALTYKGLATCILNADFDHQLDSIIRKLLHIKESEIFIGFVSLGHYPETFKVPVSQRDSFEDCLITH